MEKGTSRPFICCENADDCDTPCELHPDYVKDSDQHANCGFICQAFRDGRFLLWVLAAYVIIAFVWACAARGQDRAPVDAPESVEYIDQDRAEWFSQLRRTDVVIDKANGLIVGETPDSCCDAGDGYPIIVDEDAYPPHIGTEANGTAHVTDPSAKMIILPDGTKKYRPAITGNLTFHFAGNKITREREGNPTKTAWAFLHVGYPSEGMDAGQIKTIFCVVPIPPSS